MNKQIVSPRSIQSRSRSQKSKYIDSFSFGKYKSHYFLKTMKDSNKLKNFKGGGGWDENESKP